MVITCWDGEVTISHLILMMPADINSLIKSIIVGDSKNVRIVVGMSSVILKKKILREVGFTAAVLYFRCRSISRVPSLSAISLLIPKTWVQMLKCCRSWRVSTSSSARLATLQNRYIHWMSRLYLLLSTRCDNFRFGSRRVVCQLSVDIASLSITVVSDLLELTKYKQ